MFFDLRSDVRSVSAERGSVAVEGMGTRSTFALLHKFKINKLQSAAGADASVDLARVLRVSRLVGHCVADLSATVTAANGLVQQRCRS